MTAWIVKLMRVASFALCAIVIASFGAFVLDQSSTASAHQAREVGAGPGGEGSSSNSTAHEGTVHRYLDEASADLTSPFASAVSGTHSEWASRGGKLVLALAIYGFGLGYLARVLRVRV
jgi:hypothetical protein